MLRADDYWRTIGGTTFLPGTNRAADRFVRASFYIDAIPKVKDSREAVAAVFSVIRNCSVPLGISTPGEPNISSTWLAYALRTRKAKSIFANRRALSQYLLGRFQGCRRCPSA
ncbi:MAG: linear amide C-N hydrolase [Alistipes indistinctus]